MLAGVPLIFAADMDDYTPWLWWVFYLTLSLVGTSARSRRRRASAMLAGAALPSRQPTWRSASCSTALWVFLSVLSLIGVVLLTGSLVMYLVEPRLQSTLRLAR
jgi:hypothetical protein